MSRYPIGTRGLPQDGHRAIHTECMDKTEIKTADEVTVETLTMKQIADLKATSTGKLRTDCIRAETDRDTLRILATLQRICAAINARADAARRCAAQHTSTTEGK